MNDLEIWTRHCNLKRLLTKPSIMIPGFGHGEYTTPRTFRLGSAPSTVIIITVLRKGQIHGDNATKNDSVGKSSQISRSRFKK